MTIPYNSVEECAALGLPATFLLGGLTRTDKPRRIPLFHGDIAISPKENVHLVVGKLALCAYYKR